MPQADRRTDEQIRRDMATCRSHPLRRVAGGTYCGEVATANALVRLLDDVAPLLAEVAALRAENERLAGINAALVRDYNHMLPLVQPQEIRDAHDFWCDEPKCMGPCNCERPRRITEDELRAELAAERARHETTRAKVRAVEVELDGSSTAWDGLVPISVIRAALAAAASPSPSDDDTSSSSPVVACRTCQGQGGFPSGVLNVMGAAGEWYEPCPDCAPSPVAGGKTGWDYAEHPGDCHPRKVDAMWVVCCRECAGTGVFPVPWISTPEEGRKRMDDSSCVSCKGTGYSTVGLHGEPSPVAGQDQPKEPT